MKPIKQKSQSDWKRAASRVLAFLFVMYALADISVLQAYCGNEAVGIPPYARQIQNNQRNQETARSVSARAVSDASQPSQQNDAPDLPGGDEECFCCCPHTLLGLNLRESVRQTVLSVKPQSTANFSLKHLWSDSHLKALDRPPRFA